MSKSNTHENQVLLHYFNGTALTAPANSYVALHTADPGEAGTQATNEVAYTGYARVTLARTAGGWTVTGNSASPAADITFPMCTGGSATATHWSIGDAASGAGVIRYSGTIASALSIATNQTPILLAASTTVTED